MRIATLKIRNFGPYRGEHVLQLDGKVYAVIARSAYNAERSNWLGKSTLLETVPFVLYGEHRHRTEDDWITKGESGGEVEITLSNGDVIRRVRERGKRTVVYFTPAAGAAGMVMQEEAQKRIDGLVGLTPDDFRSTCFFEQRQMARFILTEPSARMKTVSAWLRLEPLERCEELAKSYARKHEDRAKEIDGALKSLDERQAAIGKREDVEAAIPEQKRIVEEAAGHVARLTDQFESNQALIAAASRVTEFQELIQKGQLLKAEVDKRNLPVLREQYNAAAGKLREADEKLGGLSRDLRAKEQVARGQFDGRCPVAGISCPATTSINEERTRAARIAEEARALYQNAANERAQIAAAEGAVRAKLQEADRMNIQLDNLREQAKRVKATIDKAKASGQPVDPAALRAEHDAASREYLQVRDRLTAMERGLADLAAIERTRATLTAEREILSKTLGVHREAVVIFGKKGAQRRVAEGSLARIEEDANHVLDACDVKLRVDIRWAREGKGLAKACDACGHPFPASVRVKACERCGAARGPQLENKLDIVLSDRSGAAEDLAGAAVQLSASRWLRDVRACAWASAFLDEPFGALDAAHRKAFGAHLAAMLSGRYGFEQAFVVAHHASVLDALPGRIEIVADENGSVPRVVA